jgi:hypothetical protein
MSGFRDYAGTDTDQLFAADTAGDGPQKAEFRKQDGSPLRYANISHGSKRADIGYRDQSASDISNAWASSGTDSYALPINNRSYSSNNQSRGQAGIRLTIYANGTYDVRDWRSDTTSTVLASGSWLPSGESAANWSVNFTVSHGNDSTIDGGTTGADTTAATSKACTADYYGQVWSKAILTTDRASCTGTIVCRLYKNGTLRGTTTISAYTNVNGN